MKCEVAWSWQKRVKLDLQCRQTCAFQQLNETAEAILFMCICCIARKRHTEDTFIFSQFARPLCFPALTWFCLYLPRQQKEQKSPRKLWMDEFGGKWSEETRNSGPNVMHQVLQRTMLPTHSCCHKKWRPGWTAKPKVLSIFVPVVLIQCDITCCLNFSGLPGFHLGWSQNNLATGSHEFGQDFSSMERQCLLEETSWPPWIRVNQMQRLLNDQWTRRKTNQCTVSLSHDMGQGWWRSRWNETWPASSRLKISWRQSLEASNVDMTLMFQSQLWSWLSNQFSKLRAFVCSSLIQQNLFFDAENESHNFISWRNDLRFPRNSIKCIYLPISPSGNFCFPFVFFLDTGSLVSGENNSAE